LRNWFFGGKGDIEVSESFFSFLAPYGDNLVTADLKAPIGIALPEDSIYDEKENPIGKMGIDGLIYVAGNDNKLLIKTIDVGTLLYDKDKNYLGTLNPDSKINREILFNIETVIILLRDKNIFNKIEATKKDQLFKRIIDLNGMPEFLKAACLDENVIAAFVDYFKRAQPSLNPEAWESVVYWLSSQQLKEIFDSYDEDKKPQGLLFAILCNSAQVKALSPEDLFKMMIDSRLNIETAELWLSTANSIDRYAQNLLRVFLLGNKVYVDKLVGETSSKQLNKTELKFIGETKAKQIQNFRKIVSEISLKDLSSEIIKGLDKRVRVEILRTMNFDPKHYIHLVDDFLDEEKQKHIHTFMNSLSPQEAVRWALNLFKEEKVESHIESFFNQAINLAKNLIFGDTSHEYQKNILQALLSRPSCVNYLGKLAQLDPNDKQLHEPLGSQDRMLFSQVSSHLTVAIGEIGRREKGNFIAECFKTLGKFQREADKDKEFKKKTVNNLSWLLKKLHIDAKKNKELGLADHQKKISKDAYSEAKEPWYWSIPLIGKLFKRKYLVEETVDEKNARETKAERMQAQQKLAQSVITSPIGLFLQKQQTSGLSGKETTLIESYKVLINNNLSAAHDFTFQGEVLGNRQKAVREKHDQLKILTSGVEISDIKKIVEELRSISETYKALQSRIALCKEIQAVSKLSADVELSSVQKLLKEQIKAKNFDPDFDVLETADLMTLADMLDEKKLEGNTSKAIKKALSDNLKELRLRVTVSMEKRLNLFEKEGHSDLLYDFYHGIQDQLGHLAPRGKQNVLREELLTAEKPLIRENQFTDKAVLADNQSPMDYMKAYVEMHGPSKDSLKVMSEPLVKPGVSNLLLRK
jgi:hypothetical protein